MTRLRQVALVARSLDGVAARLESGLGLERPFRDPGVAEFGLHNVVYALEDTFLEVVSPTRDNTTAGRFLDRLGDDGGYMVIVQVDDLAATRARAEALGIRTVWSIDLEDIAASHLHPKDLGAVTSIDQPVDAASWRWGGPDWEQRRARAKLISVYVGGADPERWSKLLDRPVIDNTITLDDKSIIGFVDGEGVVAVDIVTGSPNESRSPSEIQIGSFTVRAS